MEVLKQLKDVRKLMANLTLKTRSKLKYISRFFGVSSKLRIFFDSIAKQKKI